MVEDALVAALAALVVGGAFGLAYRVQRRRRSEAEWARLARTMQDAVREPLACLQRALEEQRQDARHWTA